MQQVLNLYKEVGETPLERIERFKKDHSDYQESKMTYAGRLDPLAEGVLIVLVDEERYEKDQYLSLPKTYQFSALFGFSTDTHDLLGLATRDICEEIEVDSVKEIVSELEGEHEFPYPPYSSRPVEGKPLFRWAREGRLDEIKIPTYSATINSLKVTGSEVVSSFDVLKKVRANVCAVTGDFRQKDILKRWEEVLGQGGEFDLSDFEVECSSGTYVRSLVGEMGKRLGCGATTYHIKRCLVGECSIEDSIRD